MTNLTVIWPSPLGVKQTWWPGWKISWCRQRRTRLDLENWLAGILRPGSPAALIGLDFGFGFPRGAAKVVFNVYSWQCLHEQMAKLMESHGKARGVAIKINERFGENGTFRTNADRSNFKFYLSNGISYFRLVECFIPQAISQWYIGSGPTVGLSSIAGMAFLGRLLRRRSQRECKFRIFPFETFESDSHGIVEIYPAICPRPNNPNWENENEPDAIRAATNLARLAHHPAGLSLPIVPGIGSAKLRQFAEEEGWISGVVTNH